MLPTSPLPEGSSSSSSSRTGPPRPLEASKWLDFLFLVSLKEIETLFKNFSEVFLFLSKGLFPIGKNRIEIEGFCELYELYLKALEGGEEIDLTPFYLYITRMESAVHRQRVDGERERIFPILPCMISQPGRLSYSSHDETFRISSFGPDTIPWGLKLSFPQLYLDPETREIMRGDRAPPSPNAPLLDLLRRWIRETTLPVAFKVGDLKIQTPYRLGKELGNTLKHPFLEERGIHVVLT